MHCYQCLGIAFALTLPLFATAQLTSSKASLNLLTARWVLANVAMAASFDTAKKLPCPTVFRKLCPEEQGDAQLECALRKESKRQGSMSTKCRIYATGLLMNSHRDSEEVLAAKPFNVSSACPLGPGSLAASASTSGSKGHAEWWAEREVERARAREHAAVGLPRPPPPLEAVNARVDFTLVTQVSASRMWMLAHLCDRWPGDIVVAVFDPPKTATNQIALPLPCRQPSAEAINTRARAIRGDVPLPTEAPEALEEAGALALPSDAWERAPRPTVGASEGGGEPALSQYEAAAAAATATEKDEDEEQQQRRLEGPLRDYLRRKYKFSAKEFRNTGAKERFRRSSGNEAPVNNSTVDALSDNSTLRTSDDTITNGRKSHAYGPVVSPRRVIAFGVPSAGPYDAFPVNSLRNAALCRVATSHALYIDVDFWPSETLYARLHEAKRIAPRRFAHPKHAIVVPALAVKGAPAECQPRGEEYRKNWFQRSSCTERTVPRNFLELQACWREHRCRPFDEFGNPEGHASTNYAAWQRTPGSELRRLPCLRSNRYEPYLVLPMAPTTPLYAEVFQGYGKNKIQHTVHLFAAGFSLSVLSRGFLVHFPHGASTARMIWDVPGVAAPPVPPAPPSGGDPAGAGAALPIGYSSSNAAADEEPFAGRNRHKVAVARAKAVPSQRASNNALYLRFLDWLTVSYGGHYGGADELTREQTPDTGSSSSSGSSTSSGRTSSGDSSSDSISSGNEVLERGKTGDVASPQKPLRVMHICGDTQQHLTWTERDRMMKQQKAKLAKEMRERAAGFVLS